MALFKVFEMEDEKENRILTTQNRNEAEVLSHKLQLEGRPVYWELIHSELETIESIKHLGYSDFQKMTVEELRSFVKEKDIDLDIYDSGDSTKNVDKMNKNQLVESICEYLCELTTTPDDYDCFDD